MEDGIARVLRLVSGPEDFVEIAEQLYYDPATNMHVESLGYAIPHRDIVGQANSYFRSFNERRRNNSLSQVESALRGVLDDHVFDFTGLSRLVRVFSTNQIIVAIWRELKELHSRN